MDYTDDDDDKSNMIDLVYKELEEVEHLLQEFNPNTSGDEATSQAPSSDQEPPPKKKLLTFLQKTESDSLSLSTIPSLSRREKLDKEVDSYLHCAKLEIGGMYQYWSGGELMSTLTLI